MLEVRDLPTGPAQPALASASPVTPAALSTGDRRPASQQGNLPEGSSANFRAMETPLVMSGFSRTRSGSGSRRWPARAWNRWPREAWAAVPPFPTEGHRRGRGGIARAGLGNQRATCARRHGDCSHLHRYVYRPEATAGVRPSGSAGRTGIAAHDHGRCGGYAGIAAERIQDHQYRRNGGSLH